MRVREQYFTVLAKFDIMYMNCFLLFKQAIYQLGPPMHSAQLLRHQWLTLRFVEEVKFQK